MNLICPRCRMSNQSGAHFCQKCGTGFSVQPVRPTRRNSISTPVIIITAIVAVCGFCGIFSLLTGNKTEVAVNTNSAIAKSFASTVPTATASPASTNSESFANTTKAGERTTKDAVVIAENVNLRRTPNSNGEVIETLVENTETEIIRQKGAWFYVRAAGKTGWLHGNTIRLHDRRQSEQVRETTVGPRPTASPKNKPSESEEVNSDDGDVYSSDSSRYITGPRGGCYYINGNGNKTYVDRSMCGGTTTTHSQSSSSSSSGGYIRGPRGGCYYINRNGNKTYVDRSLCN